MTDSTQYDLGTENDLHGGPYRTRIDDQPPSTVVASLVAAATDRDAVDLPPLHRVLDTDALNAFVRPGPADESERARIEFRYVDCDVTVYSDGEVVVESDDAD